MTTNICLFLNCSVNIKYDSNRVNKGNQRIEQYAKGIEQIVSYQSLKNTKIIFSDNTLFDKSELPESISKNLSLTTQFLFTNNNSGIGNKGLGVLNQILLAKELLSKYELVIYYEPRQYLIDYSFFNTVLSNPKNTFYIHRYESSPHIWTGLFALNSFILVNMCEDVEVQNDLKNEIPIEYAFYKYICKNNIEYSRVNTLNLIWHDVYQNRFVTI
jgi:hypothetical protein